MSLAPLTQHMSLVSNLARAAGCSPCTKCGETQFLHEVCSARTDAICRECSDLFCAQDEVQSTAFPAEASSSSDGHFDDLVSFLFREGCGHGHTGSCKECSRCNAAEYLLKACSAQEDSVCQECSILEETECSGSRSGYQNATAVSTGLSGCGGGKRGQCITVSVSEARPQVEPLWLVVIMIVAIAVLTLTLCGVALHLRRWLQKKKQKMQSQHESNTGESNPNPARHKP